MRKKAMYTLGVIWRMATAVLLLGAMALSLVWISDALHGRIVYGSIAPSVVPQVGKTSDHWVRHIISAQNDNLDDAQIQRQGTILRAALDEIRADASDALIQEELDRILTGLVVGDRDAVERDEMKTWVTGRPIGPARLAALLEDRVTRADDDSTKLVDTLSVSP